MGAGSCTWSRDRRCRRHRGPTTGAASSRRWPTACGPRRACRRWSAATSPCRTRRTRSWAPGAPTSCCSRCPRRTWSAWRRRNPSGRWRWPDAPRRAHFPAPRGAARAAPGGAVAGRRRRAPWPACAAGDRHADLDRHLRARRAAARRRRRAAAAAFRRHPLRRSLRGRDRHLGGDATSDRARRGDGGRRAGLPAAPGRQQPLRARAGGHPARRRPGGGGAVPRPRAPRQRRAADRRVPPRLRPRRPLRDLAGAGRRSGAGGPPGDGAAAGARGRHAGGDRGRAHRFPRDGDGAGVLRRAGRGERRGGPGHVRNPHRHAGRAGARVTERFNRASWFVDRHLEEGRGDRVALYQGAGQTTYEQLAALVNRTGHVLRDLGVRQEERVLLALSDGVEFVATWYAAQKIGAVTAEGYTLLPPKDFAYYLDYTRAGVVVVDAATLDRMRDARAALGVRPWPRTLLAVGVEAEQLRDDGEASFDTLVAEAPDALDPAPTP